MVDLLVALSHGWDLLLSAKHLFVAAILAGPPASRRALPTTAGDFLLSWARNRLRGLVVVRVQGQRSN